MKAKITGIMSADCDDLVNTYFHENEEFSIWLQVFVGALDEKGDDRFEINVCSPSWILKQVEKDEILFGFHHLIAKEFDFYKIRKFLEKYINSIEGKNWNEIANKLRKIGYWEFEDYVKNNTK